MTVKGLVLQTKNAADELQPRQRNVLLINLSTRLSAVEARMTKQEKQAMKQKKKPTNDDPLRGPNSQNTMRWTAG